MNDNFVTVGVIGYSLIGSFAMALTGLLIALHGITHRWWWLLGAAGALTAAYLFFWLVIIASNPVWLPSEIARAPWVRVASVPCGIFAWAWFFFYVKSLWTRR